MQYTAIPTPVLNRMIRQLDRLEGELKKHKSEWITTGDFMKRTGKTREQVRYMRENSHPEFFKRKGTTGHYLIDYAKYQKAYNS